MIKWVLTLGLAATSAMVCLAATDLADSIKSGELWKMDKSELGAKYMQGVRYSPVDDKTQRIDARNTLTIGKIAPAEMLFKWDGEHLASIQIIIYNKGDDGALEQTAFENKVKNSVAAVEEVVGAPGKAAKVSEKETGIKTRAWDWEWETGAIHLDSGSTGGSSKNKKKPGAPFTAEFIRLNLGPDAAAIETGGARDAVAHSELKKNLRHEENGDVWLDNVPMVDQGDKGYCVPASISRVFAYYGMDGVDQHALAAICGSSGAQGTRTDNMEESMQQICKKFPIRIVNLENKKLRDYTTFIMDLIGRYNKTAKSMGKDGISEQQGSQFFDVADPDVLLKTRAGKSSDVNKWMGDISKQINSGIPVLWCVTLGIYKESVSLPQGRGGHMRLIIGYNKAEKTIIYTDSWGSGHERKSMPAAEAMSMTSSRYVLRR